MVTGSRIQKIAGRQIGHKGKGDHPCDHKAQSLCVDLGGVLGELRHFIGQLQKRTAPLDPKSQRGKQQLDGCVDQRAGKNRHHKQRNVDKVQHHHTPDGGVDHQNGTHQQLAQRIRLELFRNDLEKYIHGTQHVAVEVAGDHQPPCHHPQIVGKQMVDATGDLRKAVDKYQLLQCPALQIRDLLKHQIQK